MHFRSDFKSLPFQAVECCLANVKPADGKCVNCSFSVVFVAPAACHYGASRQWLLFLLYSVYRLRIYICPLSQQYISWFIVNLSSSKLVPKANLILSPKANFNANEFWWVDLSELTATLSADGLLISIYIIANQWYKVFVVVHLLCTQSTGICFNYLLLCLMKRYFNFWLKR